MIAPLLALALQAAAAAPACAYTAGAATLAVPGQPFAAEPSPDGCELYVPLAQGDRGGVAVFRNTGGAFASAGVTPLPKAVLGSALSRDGALLALAAGDELLLVDTARLRSAAPDAVVARVRLPNGAGAVEALFSPDGATVFVSEERTASIAMVDVVKARAGQPAVVGRAPQGRAPVGMALSPDGTRLYSTSQVAGGEIGASASCRPESPGQDEHGAGMLVAFDTAALTRDPRHSAVAVAGAGCNPVRVAVSPDGARVWVTARGENALLGFDAATLTPDGRARPTVRVKLGPAPVGLAATPDGRSVWVSDSARFGGRAGLSRVDASGATPAVAETRSASGFPRDLRLMPDGRTLLVAEFVGRAVRVEP